MSTVHGIISDKKKSEKTKIMLDKFLSSAHVLLTEHCKRNHTGKIKFVGDMHDGIPLKINSVFEVQREITPE